MDESRQTKLEKIWITELLFPHMELAEEVSKDRFKMGTKEKVLWD